MQQIALIIACLAIGIVLRWTGKFPETTTKALSGWVIYVALPAAALRSLHGLSPQPSWLLAAATCWITVALAIAVIVPLARGLGWSRHRIGALLLVAGWGNTSFVGLPMIAAFAGAQWLGLGIVIDLFGSYLALSTIGLAIAAVSNDGHFDWRSVVRRIVTFPPFIAIIAAFLLNDVAEPEWLTQLIGSLADTLTPLALAAVGFALKLDRLTGRLAPLGIGLAFRLVAAPLAILALYLAFGNVGDPVAKVAILEAAMPPMLGASIIAMDNDLEPDLVALLIGIGVPLSLLTAWGWWSLIARL